MINELDKTVDTLIQQLREVHQHLGQYHGDINRIIKAGTKFEGVQNHMHQVLSRHDQRLASLHDEHKQYDALVREHLFPMIPCVKSLMGMRIS